MARTNPLRKGYFHSFLDSHLFKSKLNSSTSFVCRSAIKNGNSRITWKKVHTRESKWTIVIAWEDPQIMILNTIINIAYRVFTWIHQDREIPFYPLFCWKPFYPQSAFVVWNVWIKWWWFNSALFFLLSKCRKNGLHHI